MKKLILSLFIVLAFAKLSIAEPTNSFLLTTNMLVRVAPIQLTAEQLDGIIQAIQGIGIKSDPLVCATNIDNIRVLRTGTNTFAILLNLRPN